MDIKKIQKIFARETSDYHDVATLEKIRMLLHLKNGHIKIEFWQNDPLVEEEVVSIKEEKKNKRKVATKTPIKKKKQYGKLNKLEEVNKSDNYYVAFNVKDLYGLALYKKMYAIKLPHKRIALQKVAEKYGFYTYHNDLSQFMWMIMLEDEEYDQFNNEVKGGVLANISAFKDQEIVTKEQLVNYFNNKLESLVEKLKINLLHTHAPTLSIFPIIEKIKAKRKLSQSQQKKIEAVKNDLLAQWILDNISQDIALSELIPTEKMADSNYVLSVITKNNQFNLKQLPNQLLEDKNFIKRCFYLNKTVIEHIPEYLKEDKNFIKPYVVNYAFAWKNLPEQLKNDIPFIIDIVNTESKMNNIKRKNAAIMQVRQSWFYSWSQHLSEEIKNNIQVSIDDYQNITQLQKLHEKRELNKKLTNHLKDKDENKKIRKI